MDKQNESIKNFREFFDGITDGKNCKVCTTCFFYYREGDENTFTTRDLFSFDISYAENECTLNPSFQQGEAFYSTGILSTLKDIFYYNKRKKSLYVLGAQPDKDRCFMIYIHDARK